MFVIFKYSHGYPKFASIRLFNMATSVLLPPTEKVKGLKELNRKLFEKTVLVPSLHLDKSTVSKAIPIIKKYLLKLENFKAVQPCNSDVTIYLNPDKVKHWTCISEEDSSQLYSLGVSNNNLKFEDITLTYNNYTYDIILKSVLPGDNDGLSSFTKIGHILHVNLREHLLPYKKLIGEVLLEKVKNCKSVVNKLDMIDNTYRNFEMEILSGEDNMQTSVKENGCLFEFDFSTVYWNSRLCTEHERIIEIVKSNDLFIDVFAGVGPFSIPIAKKGCYVHANDLNPESYRWLNHNMKINKVKEDYIKTYNKDGKDFIKTEVKNILMKNINNYNIHIVMNLPALAVEFVPHFVGLLKENTLEIIKPPVLYVYCFAKGSETNTDFTAIAKTSVIKNIGFDISDKIINIFEVRTVSNFKKMMRVSLKLDKDILIGTTENLKRKRDDIEQDTQKILKCENGEEKTQ
ncbi:hypothetical protein HHI36_011903 [Cryptolaemus montrouzieri]|uniref:tRNA (guanine(37)-N1)-methyltransferase n=1 Tax=Cryptolaemus montrouzieri TaxID=559131 RepID=A0ABD2NCX7_9CUCU